MLTEQELKTKANAAKDKAAAIGPDIDLSMFHSDAPANDTTTCGPLQDLPAQQLEDMLMAGVDVNSAERGGTFIMKDTHTMHCSVQQDGLEVIPIRQALEHHDWVREHYWNLASPDTDKYTASVALDLHDGYVIRAKAGSKSVYPLQACLYMDQDNSQQNVHNIIVVEEGAELHMISGCATSPNIKKGIHVGVNEFYIGKNAKLSFTMIHNWGESVAVRPRSYTTVAEGGQFISNYVCMKPVHDLQMYPTCTLDGPDAVGRFYSILVGTPVTNIDAGGRVILNHPGCRAEIVSRAITNGGEIMARGHLVGKAPDIKAHLECRGLILGGGAMLAVPQLDGYVDGVEMSHEAAVGKIAQEEINYLMTRGLDEDEATSTIVRGFLSVDIPGLPPQLQAEIDKAVNATDEHAM